MLSFKHQANRLQLSVLEKLNAQLIYHPIGCALVWRQYYRSIQNIKNNVDRESYCEVMFEDLKQSPEKTLDRVQTFLGVHIDSNLSSIIKKKNTSFPSGERPQLKSDDIFWMNIICHQEIAALGLEKKKYSNFIKIIFSFFKIPVWAISAFIHLSKYVNGSVFLYIKKRLF